MTDKYNDWITENVKETYGKCKEATLKMQEAFPEFKRVKGHYYDLLWGERAHWWLVSEEGIVDPTAAQFPTKGTGEYIEWVGEEATGKCPNCGDYTYENKTCCCDVCSEEFGLYLNRERLKCVTA